MSKHTAVKSIRLGILRSHLIRGVCGRVLDAACLAMAASQDGVVDVDEEGGCCC